MLKHCLYGKRESVHTRVENVKYENEKRCVYGLNHLWPLCSSCLSTDSKYACASREKKKEKEMANGKTRFKRVKMHCFAQNVLNSCGKWKTVQYSQKYLNTQIGRARARVCRQFTD